MIISKFRGFLGVTVSILYLLIISTAANAQAIKTTVGDILSNPDQYDGKMVQVKGIAGSVKEKVSKKSNFYTTFKISNENNVLSVFSFGKLSLHDGDSVRVMGKYQKIKQVGRYTFYNEIDASGGSVEKNGSQNKIHEQNAEEKNADEREWQR